MEKLHALEGQIVTVVYSGGWLQGTLSETGNAREWIVTTMRGAHKFWESDIFAINIASKVVHIS